MKQIKRMTRAQKIAAAEAAAFMQSSANISGPWHEYELRCFHSAKTYRVTRYTGNGASERDQAEIDDWCVACREAVLAMRKGMRVTIHAIIPEGQAVLMDPKRWLEYTRLAKANRGDTEQR